jgi:hypothetical protein
MCVSSTYEILYALYSVCILLKQNFVPFALLRLFVIYITAGFAGYWNQISIGLQSTYLPALETMHAQVHDMLLHHS